MAARTLEMEFLPAALEVEQTPALPAARLIILAIVLFFFVAIAWACVACRRAPLLKTRKRPSRVIWCIN